jgi:uncharacterized membrane protein YsdA (DUF1294 family)
MNLAMGILGAYVVNSLLTFLIYAWDKRAARRGRERVPEVTLHTLELFGGWPGALLAQRLIRHKNAKVSYQVVFWLIVTLHACAWFAWWRFSR